MPGKIRTTDEIISLIKLNKALPSWVEDARKYHCEWKALFYGEEFKERLIRLDHIESAKKQAARKKFAKPIKDLNEKLSRPIDSIYSAVGGSKSYKFENEKLGRFLKLITNLRENKSLEKWLETYWAKDLYIVDPSGLIFLEYYEDKWVKPVYKSIDIIRNYEAYGQKLEWVLFEPVRKEENSKQLMYWRYVDAEQDMTVKQDGEIFTEVTEKSFKHPFGEVPALTCSNIQRLGRPGKLSPFDKIKEDQEEFLSDKSILTLYKSLNGFPIPVEPAIICRTCRGTGKLDHQKCPDCDGQGELMRKDVTDSIKIPIKVDAETISFPTNLGFYISPDLETWTKYEEVLNDKTMSEYDTLWGITIDKEQQQTATEIMINAQPKIHKLMEWSDVAQFMEWQITEWIANWFDQTKNKADRISSIYYGRVYLIRTVEQITRELGEAIKNSLPDSMKDKLYTEYLTTKYKNDPETLSFELKKSYLEYWPFYSVKDVNDYIGPEAAKKKMLFKDWWESLTEKEKLLDEKQLEEKRDTWMNSNINQNKNQNG